MYTIKFLCKFVGFGGNSLCSNAAIYNWNSTSQHIVKLLLQKMWKIVHMSIFMSVTQVTKSTECCSKIRLAVTKNWPCYPALMTLPVNKRTEFNISVLVFKSWIVKQPFICTVFWGTDYSPRVKTSRMYHIPEDARL